MFNVTTAHLVRRQRIRLTFRWITLISFACAGILFLSTASPSFAESNATVTVVYNPPSCGAGAIDWDPDAHAAFQYAANTWGALLTTNQTVIIHACWRTDQGANTLGSASATDVFENFGGAPYPDTLYPVALANALSGMDLNGPDPEINANFNSTIDWYFGTDGNVPKDQLEFVAVVLHEIGHGLGIAGGFIVTGGLGKRLNPSPAVYDQLTEDNAGISLLDPVAYPDNSANLAAALQSNALFFDGPLSRLAYADRRVPIYAPSVYSQGSTYSHVAEIFNFTPDALMTYELPQGESKLHPGWISLNMLRDMGWAVTDDGGPSPALVVLPEYRSFTADADEPNPAAQSVELHAHRFDAAWTATVSSGSGWLTTNGTAGIGGGPIILTATTEALPTGYYPGKVVFTLNANPAISTTLSVPLLITGTGSLGTDLVQQGNMEDGSAWEEDSEVWDDLIVGIEINETNIARSGVQVAALGLANNEISRLRQTLSIPNEGFAYLVYHSLVISNDICGYDISTVLINNTEVASQALCQQTEHNEWRVHVVDLAAYRGQEITLEFRAVTDDTFVSSWYLDDVALYAATLPGTLTVAKAGNGSGSVVSEPIGIDCGEDCSEVYENGTVVTLTVVADANSTFTGWTGACMGMGNCVVPMDTIKQVNAGFALKSFDLTVAKNGAGTVSSSPLGINCGSDCSETYFTGTIVTLTAVAETGSLFSGWDGACTDSGACVINIDAAKQVTAAFALEAIAGLTITTTNSGATLLGTPTEFFANISAGGNVTYHWDFGDDTSGTGKSVSHTYAAAGNYIVTVTASNGVNTQMETVNVTVVTETGKKLRLPSLHGFR